MAEIGHKEATPYSPEGEKEDPYDFEEKRTKNANGARVFGIALIIAGLITSASSFPILIDLSSYESIRAPLSEVESPFAFEMSLPYLILGMGFLIIVAGILAILGYFKKERKIVVGSMALALIGAGVALFAALRIDTALDGLLTTLQGNPVVDDFNDGEKSVMDFTAAIFNECCLSQYDSIDYGFENTGPIFREGSLLDDNQRPVGVCKQTVEETCPTSGSDRMFPEIIASAADALSSDTLDSLLCHCISSEEEAALYAEILTRDNLCEQYRNIQIPKADERVIPVINLSFNSLIRTLGLIRPEIRDELPIGTFAMVGKIFPPKSIYGEPEEDIGFSCGLGYAKSMALYLHMYLTDKTVILVSIALTGVGFTCASVFLLMIFWFAGGTNSNDDMEYDDEYADAPYATAAPPGNRQVRSQPAEENAVVAGVVEGDEENVKF